MDLQVRVVDPGLGDLQAEAGQSLAQPRVGLSEVCPWVMGQQLYVGWT